METTVLSLKKAIDELLAHYNLSLSRIRGQGYDGASNMSGDFNGLKAFILKENSSAYYVHCFAHQLQLVVVALANKHHEIFKFFNEVSSLVNVVGASCKRIDLIRESQRERLGLNPEVETGSGQNQELSLARAGDTQNSGDLDAHKIQANGLLLYMRTYTFVFYLHLMKHILGVTNKLCEALQRKDQDILNAVKLVKTTKEELQTYRLEGFDSLLIDVTSFCEKYNIEMVNMEAIYVDPKNRRRKKTGITNRQYYVINNFNTVLNMQIQELGYRFNELVEMYPCDFNFDEKDKLIYELGNYIANVKKDTLFNYFNG
ncbi:uncharacterized protein LOC143606518, partial [Bidens hawaiensis]|uniref:uncharacterized protein LOC143606518 n=1 Tax=Bidens hawaiensis TaxID=980011 RepID=UPI004049E1A7